ncbi:MAG: DEAD/DEAH box helicase, partial [Nanoarchaeota archaeon]
MIETLKEPYNAREVNAILHPLVREWFFSKFKEFSLPQLYGVMEIHLGRNILVSAPTGATKTLTGFLAILNELVGLAKMQELEDRVYCIYISPLKALNYDIGVNLNGPLDELNQLNGKDLGIRVGVRTGDTSTSERSKML